VVFTSLQTHPSSRAASRPGRRRAPAISCHRTERDKGHGVAPLWSSSVALHRIIKHRYWLRKQEESLKDPLLLEALRWDIASKPSWLSIWHPPFTPHPTGLGAPGTEAKLQEKYDPNPSFFLAVGGFPSLLSPPSLASGNYRIIES